MAQAVAGLKAGYEKAIKDNQGQWPNKEQLAAAMHDIRFAGYGREVVIDRKDGQGLEAQLFGITKKSDQYPFKVLDQITIVPAQLVTPPDGMDSFEWIEQYVSPDMLSSETITKF